MSTQHILIEYGIVQNTNKHKGGWLPQLWIDGKARYLGLPEDGPDDGSVRWAPHSYDRGIAWQEAVREAQTEASRYVGDWDIAVLARGCTCCAVYKRDGGPSHIGSRHCQSDSLASGGEHAHCSCDTCF